MLFHRRLIVAWLLNLLLPGLGHIYWKEYTFGIFVYLVLLLASVLYVATLMMTLPAAAMWFILGLPILFYVFSFVDLSRVVKRKRATVSRSTRAALIILAVGLIYQVLSPTALLNFGWRNRPEIYRMPNNRLNPRFAAGDLIMASRLAYHVSIPLVDYPILRQLPERFEMVRFDDGSGRRRTGFVVGLPLEEIQIVGGLVVADGLPDPRDGPVGISLTGDWPLTRAGRLSILVATVNMGSLDQVYEVPLTKPLGKVDKLF